MNNLFPAFFSINSFRNRIIALGLFTAICFADASDRAGAFKPGNLYSESDSSFVDEGSKNSEISDTIALERIIVKGPLFPRYLMQIPSSTVNLRASNITRNNSTSVVEELNQVPGIYAHTGTLNTNRITIRGIGSRTPYGTNRIKAYWNEIPLTEGDGNTNIDDLDPMQIQSFEITKGAKSALYGMGLGGVMLISSEEPTAGGFYGSAGAEVGSFGVFKPYINLGGGNNKVNILASYAYNHSDGWRQNSAYKRHNLTTQLSYTAKAFKADLFFNFINLFAKIPSSLNEQTFLNSPDSAAANWLAVEGREEYMKVLTGLKFQSRISAQLKNTTLFFLNAYMGEEYRPFNVLEDRSFQVGVRSFFHWKLQHLDLKFGTELFQNRYTWTTFENENAGKGAGINNFTEQRIPVSIFAQAGLEIWNKSIVEIGISYNLLKYTLSDLNSDTSRFNGNYSYKPVFSPFIGVNIPINKNIRVFSSVGHGFSPPTVEETLMPDGSPNTSIKPESGWNAELGSRITAISGRMYLDGTFYIMQVKDLLVTKRLSEEVFFGENAGKTLHKGFELLLTYWLRKSDGHIVPRIRTTVSLSIQDNHFTDFVDNGVDFSGNQLPGIPTNNLLVLGDIYLTKSVYLNYSFTHHGSQYLDDSNQASYEGYQLHHAKLGINLNRALRMRTKIYFGIKNVFNSKYASMILINAPSFSGSLPRYYYPGLPRYFYSGIGLNF
ncbi:MAG TPA: hypothetical protein DDX98_10725 [Bacteroidales bacterium]|nr:hypothetical protein [Bacteroidales bacterium]